ncbi:MAG: COX15/CtaA family protein [Haloarculaceae archaeon]
MDTVQSQGSATALARRVGGWFVAHARGIAAVTVGVTFLLILLGEFTAAAGAGATCNNTYPGCAGQLSPIGLSVPQFIEWFHRLVAMLTGYLIVGNAVVLWYKHRGTRVSRSAWLAAILLPLQVLFGGLTVTLAGLVPGGYSPPVQLTHFTTALAIFVALVLTYVWLDELEGRGATRGRLQYAALGGVGLAVLQSAFARGFLFTFWPGVQTAYHFFGLLELALFLAALLWGRELGRPDAAALGAIGAVVTVLNAYLIIGLFVVTAQVVAVTYLLLFVQFVVFAALAWSVYRTPDAAAASPAAD